MDLQRFTAEVAAQFLEKIDLGPDTDFRKNDFFDSLIGMAILVMIKDNYNYDMGVPAFLSCKTPRDLYNQINQLNNESK
jgi:acyl carrier protein